MSYAHFFDNPASAVDLSGDVVIDMEHLSHEQKALVISWLQSQADRLAAQAKLKEVLKQALFDVTAAELGAMLHKPGNA